MATCARSTSEFRGASALGNSRRQQSTLGLGPNGLYSPPAHQPGAVCLRGAAFVASQCNLLNRRGTPAGPLASTAGRETGFPKTQDHRDQVGQWRDIRHLPLARAEFPKEDCTMTKDDRKITIYVNTKPKSIDAEEVTYAQVVDLAFPKLPYGENTETTVTYRRGPRGNLEGNLKPGESIKIREGMIFSVTATDKS